MSISADKVGLLLSLFLCYFVANSLQQSSISLNDAQWFVKNSNNSIVLPAQVPGGIYTDLRRNNVLKQDILYGKNDLAYRWVGNENWTYYTSFTIDHQIGKSQSVKLVIHGIDSVATVYLNGHEIGYTENMFVRYKFDIKNHLKLPGLENILLIKFESATKYGSRKSKQSIRNNRGKIIPPFCPPASQRGECHVNFVRKMQASFSWDWGPAFPSMGIYKNIDIEYGSFGIIRDILVDTRRLPPLVQPNRRPTASPQVLISSSIRQQVRTPTVNRTVPYIRAPPYYMGAANGNLDTEATEQGPMGASLDSRSGMSEFGDTLDEFGHHQLMEENWSLKLTLVAEMVQPSFGYNLRIEFNLNGVLHYESEHINVVANSDGFIRLGFNLRIDTSRLRIKPWWPNNAGGQTLYILSARMMPIPNANSNLPEHIRIRDPLASAGAASARRRARNSVASSSEINSADTISDDPPAVSMSPEVRSDLDTTSESNEPQISELSSRDRPPRTGVASFMTILSTQQHISSYLLQYVSHKEISFGFRTVELIQEPITKGNVEDGLTFGLRINGVDLFAMGSNWIPSHVLPEYSNDIEMVRYLLQSAKDANMNMIRVWGGGLYESDEFYKLADQMGIMIWQDMMFACALYPADDDFLASVRLEVEQQVQRLQYHPSIVLWAGNNENEMAIAGHWWPEVMAWNKKLRENYAKLYIDTIRPIVQILDPTRPYVDSSPSNGHMSETQPNGIARTPNENKYGDVHHYDYMADSFDWNNYPSCRFASEYGFQSYPSFSAMASVTTPSDWKYPLTANVMHRQHRMTGETEIKHQIRIHFNEVQPGGEDKFKQYLYVSQLTQAIAIKTETEFYRRNRFVDPDTKLGKTMGALYWQLNDVWHAPTWSSIEHGGKWKMLHYFARRFFFPIHVTPYMVAAKPTGDWQSGGSSTGTYGQQQPFATSLGGFGSSGLLTGGGNLSSAYSGYGRPLGGAGASESGGGSGGSTGAMLVLDLVRDDLFYLLDSFNVTIKFYRWTSFTPVWQDVVYVKNTRPQNVTRIYECELARIVRQPGVYTLSNGVFQVVVEQQSRLGLSQLDNYLMPVVPSRVTGMRAPRLSVELIQGPFELSEPLSWRSERPRAQTAGAASQWACAYRLTLVSDSIAMFVWLDLNLPNGAQAAQQGSASANEQGGSRQRPSSEASGGLGPAPARGSHSHGPPAHIHIHADQLPGHLRLSGSSLPSEPANNSRRSGLSYGGERVARRASSSSVAGGSLATATTTMSTSLGGPGSNQAGVQFKPLPNTGSDTLRYQFSDNAFNMFEPSKAIDLYLNRCLSKAQVEVALEIQSLVDSL